MVTSDKTPPRIELGSDSLRLAMAQQKKISSVESKIEEVDARFYTFEVKTESQFKQLQQSAQRRLQIAAMQQEIENLKRRSVFVPIKIEIQSLSSFGINLKKPIPISIRRVQYEYVASWLDGGLSSSGETVEVAFDEVKSIIADSFEQMRNTPVGTKLGLAIARKFAYWVEFIS